MTEPARLWAVPKQKRDLAAYKVVARENAAHMEQAQQRVEELRTQRERLIQIMRAEGCTMQEIGEALGVSRNRIWQQLKAV